MQRILRPLASLALVLLAAAPALAFAASPSREPFTLVGMDEAERMLSERGVVFVDANTRETFEKNHLRGARFYGSAPLARLLPADRSTKVVFYCASPA